jgi:hypothetical protein
MSEASRPLREFRLHERMGALVTRHSSLITGAALLLLLAGCSTPKLLQGQDRTNVSYFEDNLRYEHPFTDAGFEYARKDAERECTSRKKVAAKVPGNCTLDRCVTNYQCINKSDATEYK